MTISVYQHQNFSLCGIKLHLKGNNTFNLYNIYNQPSCNYDLQTLPHFIPSINDNFLLVGDFNAHNSLWDSQYTEADAGGIKIEDMINNYDLCILNDCDVSTYHSKTHESFSSIDLSICSSRIVDRFEWNILEDFYTSDHLPILITCLGHFPNDAIPRYNTGKADWNKYEHYTRQIPPYDHNQNHDATADFIFTFITNAADKSMPKTSNRLMKHCVPWWSETLSQLIEEKQTLSRKLESLNKRFNTLSNTTLLLGNSLTMLVDITIEISLLKPHYNKICAKFRKEAIRGKIMSWQKYVESISNNTSISKVWQKFRKINGTNSCVPRHALLHNGIRVHDPKDISNILGNSIAKISSINNLDAHFRTIKTREEAVPLNFESVDDLYYNRNFTEEEFNNALNNCSSTAPGQDCINFEMISHLAPIAKAFLLQYYNTLWTKHLFPKVWKHAIIVPIAKPGKDPSNPINYRPISLTSCLCKLLEKMVNYRLNWYLRKNKVLSPTQFGSQAERSTLDSLSHLENYIRRGFERKQITAAVFFDIQKAYDTTWRHSILKALY